MNQSTSKFEISLSASYGFRCSSISRTFRLGKRRSIWSCYQSISPMRPLTPSSIQRTFTQFQKSWERACKGQDRNDIIDDVEECDEPVIADQKRAQKVTDYLNELSAEQQIAVNASAKVVRIIACPGSGKTRVLISKAAKLISRGVHPENILMLTFTDREAKEVKNQLQDLVGSDFPGLEKLSNGTFRSICTDILQEHISKFKDGRNRNFLVINDEEKEKIILDMLMEHYSIPILEEDSATIASAKKKQNTKLRKEQREKAKNYSQMISYLKETSKTVHGLTGEKISEQIQSWKQEENKDLIWVFDKYQGHLRDKNLFDFGDPVGNVVWLLNKSPTVRKELKSQFRHILVDEMQDINLPQYEMIRLLIQNVKGQSGFNDNKLFAVGDPNQAIYGFQGARVEYLVKSMEKDFGKLMETHYLLDNYRSQASIVRYAEGILKEFTDTSSYSEMVVIREDDNGEQLQHVISKDGTEEAAMVVSQIEKLTKEHGYELNDIGVLCTVPRLCSRLEQEFQQSKVPYCLEKRQCLMKKSEIKDVIAYLRFAVNPSDECAFERIINKSIRGFGPKTLKKLREWAEENGNKFPKCIVADLEDHWKESEGSGGAFQVPKLDLPEELELRDPAKSGIQKLRESYCKLRKAARDASVKGEIQSLMQDCGYEQFLREAYRFLYTGEKRLESVKLNIEAFMNSVPVSLDQDQDKLSDLRRFVQTVALDASSDGSVNENKEGVQLMTTHSAKGLEFPVVIFVGCEDGLVPVRLKDSAFEEEKRLMFVAVTRAKDIVIFSTATTRSYIAARKFMSLSPFPQPPISKRPVADNRMSLPSQN